jgi:hypothetical protein
VTLLTELDAFFTDHRQCGDLNAGVDGPIVWIGCACGARMARRWTRTMMSGGMTTAVPEPAAAAAAEGRGRRRADGAPLLRQGRDAKKCGSAPSEVLKVNLQAARPAQQP